MDNFLVLFSILALVDFYRWEYAYGHNLDPHAAIQVPGMTYQPPLIGYKQLLNFGAYSYPHGGGWFYIAGVSLACIILGIRIWQIKNKIVNYEIFRHINTNCFFHLYFRMQYKIETYYRRC